MPNLVVLTFTILSEKELLSPLGNILLEIF